MKSITNLRFEQEDGINFVFFVKIVKTTEPTWLSNYLLTKELF